MVAVSATFKLDASAAVALATSFAKLVATALMLATVLERIA